MKKIVHLFAVLFMFCHAHAQLEGVCKKCLPSIENQSGKFLSNNGQVLTWQNISRVDLGAPPGNQSNYAYGAGDAAHLADDFNTGIGYGALELNDSCCNTAMGVRALSNNISGYKNEAFGISALFSNVSGYYNAAFGNGALNLMVAGYKNVGVGANAGKDLQHGVGNTLVGYYCMENMVNVSYATAIGSEAIALDRGVALGAGARAREREFAIPDNITKARMLLNATSKSDGYYLAFNAKDSTLHYVEPPLSLSNSFAPEAFVISNLDTLIAYPAIVTRNAYVVTVIGSVYLHPLKKNIPAEFELTLPVPRDFLIESELMGTITGDNKTGLAFASTTSDRARFKYTVVQGLSRTFVYRYSYVLR